MKSSTSLRDTRPPRPVPSISEMSIPFSPASFRTAGVALTSERSGRSAVAVAAAEDWGAGDGLSGGGGAARVDAGAAPSGAEGRDAEGGGTEGPRSLGARPEAGGTPAG